MTPDDDDDSLDMATALKIMALLAVIYAIFELT